MDKYSYIANAHGDYIEQMYESFKQDPSSVDESWKRFFEGFEFSLEKFGENPELDTNTTSNGQARPSSGSISEEMLQKEVGVRQLINAYRSRAHLVSDTNPVRKRKDRKARLDLEDFGLSIADLNTVFSAGSYLGMGSAKLSDILDRLKKIYYGYIGFEFMSIREPEVLSWIQEKIEHEYPGHEFSHEDKRRILSKLNEAVVFENFLHTKFVGQKRFSLEGGESTIAGLDTAIFTGADLGVEEVVIGMAHRGRLNVLTNIMGKTYDEVFNEFEGQAVPDETMGDGDVKYHLGFSSQIETHNGKKVRLDLSPNPSHLEAVDPVVLGVVRAKVDSIYEKDSKRILPILIHGDAAIAGQGIVYETVQMSNLAGYDVGGTIHFVINNQVGFTTDFDDARSSIYCTDVSQLIESPVLHVNGDHPEEVAYAMKLAVEFRQRYNRDIFVDMVCYRRHGHNESDEPKFTQPKLYNIIAKHQNPREIYIKKLVEQGEVNAQLAKQMDKEFRRLLQDRLNDVRQNPLPYRPQELEIQWKQLKRGHGDDFDNSPDTSISATTVEAVGHALTTVPDGFKPLKQIDKLIAERKEMFFDKKVFNWAAAELMAYGSILLDNKIVRITGQDVQRGTFSHRHAVLNDAETNEKYSSLDNIGKLQAPFYIYNSLLSEYGVLGFEYGYAMANPSALTIWEAQFGDFSNGAQTMIDQFITSGESKWGRSNGLIMLLPHGYEGQGPEHSNARPERYLQLAAEYNIVLGNFTTPANFFHAIRRQLTWDFRKPLIVMTPKSMLRHPKCISPVEDFTKGKFEEVYDDASIKDPKKVEKVLLCTGKIYYDLLEKQEKENRQDVAIVRVEQLHPFPEKKVNDILSKYSKHTSLKWVQEEPVNMGYWTYILRAYRNEEQLIKMRLVSRKPSASPATGFPKVHKRETDRIVTAAFE
ncbi:2-oxoglutarate dehydrogenase E1 component [Flammeovirga yaeyamensis]|uniref:oxoglutarate dehydrogenase (succinyl-transferring) n=1 Tax=Flammeovirga yaeyamensis TaxID=367791 RepID=A0AAX1N8B4_9BACT|nr:2-oxoglutarate dehydrogenase E1 component [Flammeovirga yaeyamensis]MBB3698902.1 2-oxoglutarate dehydrogenase E1 component [Flammeovirga yaeyamensis]NMF36337.1 2-oxoglutarate dehydrogenase E1 component [Flammeovirga yaeyamensis]QWG03702.1 2-oxoglutarate dehydrogenase E1 component [Flammeovirga yaeyamensis]